MLGVEIWVTGRVQGVGFRYFTLNTAVPLQLKGWVKNMPDGSVLIRAAGDESALDSFRAALRQGPSYGRVDKLDETTLTADDTKILSSFKVTY